MKFLFFTDLHLWDKNISTRLDVFSETVLKKLEKIVDYALKQEVDFVISGGDDFHGRIDDKEYLNLVVSQFAKLKDANIPFYTVMSNHIVKYNDYFDYKKRDIGILVNSGLVRLEPFIEFEDNIIVFHHAYRDIDLRNVILDKVKFVIAHAYLKENYAFKDDLIVSVEEYSKIFKNLEAVFLGHDHKEYPVYKYNNINVYRIGGASRVSSAKENTERIPKFCLVNYSKNNLSIIYQNLSDVTGDKIFNLTVKDTLKSIDFDIENFLLNLEKGKESDNLVLYLKEKLNTLDKDLKSFIINNYLKEFIIE